MIVDHRHLTTMVDKCIHGETRWDHCDRVVSLGMDREGHIDVQRYYNRLQSDIRLRQDTNKERRRQIDWRRIHERRSTRVNLSDLQER